MAKTTVSRAIKLYGTEVADGAKRVLKAGHISAVLDNGAIRYVRYRGVEVLRGIAYLVRDKNWGTYSPVIEKLKVRQGDDGFMVSYSAICRDAEQGIRYDASIQASASGTLKFSAHGTPITDLVTNRTGFVVLHPLIGVVGEPVEIVHTDGKKRKSRFPKFISPGQPVFEIRSLKHTVMPGVSATVLMEGNKFEMEDHRNWMDASYKTYVCSLLDPWPYTLKKRVAFDQSITLKIEGKPRARLVAAKSGIAVELDGAKGRIPSVGSAVPMAEAEAALSMLALVEAAAPDHLVAQVDGRRSGAREAATAFRQLGEKTGKPVKLEIVLPAQKPADVEVERIAADVKSAGLRPAQIVITQMHDLKSFQPNAPRPWGPGYEEMAKAVRSSFPGVPLGGGMLSFFTELNRKPVPKGLFDFVTHTVCPIVHAADDVSVMETLESLPSIFASTRNMIGKAPYHLGPSGIPCRDNPYGASVAPNPDGRRVCLSDVDPRQRGLFAAAWNLGLVAAAARGGLDAIALGALTGPQGVIAAQGTLHPAFHVLAGFGAASGARRLEARSSAQSRVEAVAYQAADGPVLWLANLMPEKQVVKVSGFAGKANLHLLDERCFGKITKNPEFLKKAGAEVKKVGSIELSAYAVVRIAAAK